MSDNRENSNNAIRPKKLTMTTFILLIGGGLGILKTGIAYIHTAMENRDILSATFYYINAVTMLVSFVFFMIYLTTRSFIESFSDKFSTYKKPIYAVYLTLISCVAAFVGLSGVLTEFDYASPDAPYLVLCIVIGATVVFVLCVVIYSQLSKRVSENF
jgi:hypothetical protein